MTRRPYVAPEVTRYGIVDAVGQSTPSPSNTASSCSCDCTFDGNCTSVGNPFITNCQFDTGSCVTGGGGSCP